jgi:hypothetical protein
MLAYPTRPVLSRPKALSGAFLNSQRIDPRSDGRPDPRPNVREDAGTLGNLVSGFDFKQAPRPPVALRVHPVTTLTGTPGPTPGGAS